MRTEQLYTAGNIGIKRIGWVSTKPDKGPSGFIFDPAKAGFLLQFFDCYSRFVLFFTMHYFVL